MSTLQKYPPLYVVFFSLFVLILVQWPASYLIHQVSLTLGILLNEWVFVLSLPLLIASRWRLPLKKIFPFQKPKARALLLTIIMTLSLVVMIDYLTFLTEKIFSPSEEIKSFLEKIMSVEGSGEGAWRWFLICLTPAVCEEIFFRGFFQATLNYHWGRLLSLFLTAISFALLHGILEYWHLYFILGFFLSFLMLVSRNLWFPIFAHLLNNSWTFLTHALGYKIPQGETWQAQDSIIFGACLIIFALSSLRFRSLVRGP